MASNNCEHIRELPLADDGPEMFGLHANANIRVHSRDQRPARGSVVRSAADGQWWWGCLGGDSWDEQVSSLASAIEQRIPAAFSTTWASLR